MATCKICGKGIRLVEQEATVRHPEPIETWIHNQPFDPFASPIHVATPHLNRRYHYGR